MWRGGRLVDPDFAPDEELFLRFPAPWSLESAACFMPFSEFSVNRSKHGGQPEDVLVPKQGDDPARFDKWGVAAFRVDAIPPTYGGFSFKVEHVPEEENYFHSHVCSFDATGAPKAPPGGIR